MRVRFSNIYVHAKFMACDQKCRGTPGLNDFKGTMKRAVSLTTLLNGNTKRKKPEPPTSDQDEFLCLPNEVKLLDQKNASLQNSEDSVKVSIDQAPSDIGSSLEFTPEKDQHSVQSLLMSGRSKKKIPYSGKDLDDPIVITLDNEVTQDVISQAYNNSESNKNLATPILPKGSVVSYPTNSKKTALKDLFKGFKQNSSEPIVLNSTTVTHKTSGNHDGIDVHRVAQNVRKSRAIPAPFPSIQLVKPPEKEYNTRPLQLKKKIRCIKERDKPSFDSSDYELLNKNNLEIADCIYTKIATSTSKYVTLWPQLLRPKTLNDVLLDPSLKRGVKEWLSEAFLKLKKPTTRNKLLKRQRLEEQEAFNDFIVYDDLETDEFDVKEFVPVMILFGEGIGKNTLIEVIMEELEGQIYEINSSSNRSKREILDNLTEFSTTHYVKGKGSKGIILLDEVDVIFKEHDKFFWQAVEKILLGSRRPIILLCRDLRYIPSNIVQLVHSETSLFQAKSVSHRTVTNFLDRYCRMLGLEIDRQILELLVHCSKKDIRKCLMDLQFACTPPGKYPVQKSSLKEPKESCIKNTSFHANVLSISDVLETSTKWKSFIPQDADNTLMTPYAISKLTGLNEDRDRLKNDYMLDYRLHLQDELNHKLLPIELNIGNKLELKVKECHFSPPSCIGGNSERNLFVMKKATASYLSSRVHFQDQECETKVRRTRNSRRFQEILERFNGNLSSSPINDVVRFDLDNTLRKNFKEQVNPFIYEIAKFDAAVKDKNRKIFLSSSREVPKEKHNELVYQLMLRGLIKPIWFKGDPNAVLDRWK